jgi:hypothetical protein
VVIHLYALAQRTGPLPELRGLDGAAVEALDCGQLRAIVSRHDEQPARTPEQALVHAAVTDAVARVTPTLPVRFDRAHRDEEVLGREIEQRGPELAQLLSEVGGCVEFVIRAVPETPAGVERSGAGGGPGQQYLAQRLAEEQAARAALEAARARLRGCAEGLDQLARASRERDTKRGPEVAYLVEAERADRFRAAAQDRTAQAADVVVGGPWPPYSFAGAPDG